MLFPKNTQVTKRLQFFFKIVFTLISFWSSNSYVRKLKEAQSKGCGNAEVDMEDC